MPKDAQTYSEGLNLPYSLEAEQAVLGAILIDAKAINEVADMLKAEHFYLPEHQAIYRVMIQKMMQNEVIDFVTVREALKSEGFFAGNEGKEYLLKLVDIVPSVGSVRRYAEMVQKKADVRKLIDASRKTLDEAMDPSADFDNLIESAEQRVYDIRHDRYDGGLTPIATAIQENYDIYNKMSIPEERAKLVGIPSGMPELDNLTTGLNRGNLIIIGARPGVGKTSFVLNLARNVAIEQHRTVAIFNLEMSKEEMVNRLLSAEAKVPSTRLRVGNLVPAEWSRLAAAASVLSQAPIYLDDSTNVTAPDIKARLRRIPDVGLVIVDYLGLMESPKKTENRVQEVSDITRGFKILAKELNIPVVVCAQLRREAAARDQRPTLVHLRESGSIEQDADQVLFLYREEMAANPGDDPSNVKFGTAEVIVAKNRHGRLGTVDMNFDGEFTQFSTASRSEQEAQNADNPF